MNNLLSENNYRAIRVLVIDDSDIIQRALKSFLQEFDIEVLTCSNGLEGIQLAIETKPRLIFLDLMMPNLDGIKILQVKQVLAEIRDIPVIIISANTNKQNVLSAMELGAVKVISKPLQKDVIIKALKEVFQHEWESFSADNMKNGNGSLEISDKAQEKTTSDFKGQLMMALFIVLWVMGQDAKVKEAVASYFKNPTGISIGIGSGLFNDGNKPIIDKKTAEVIVKELEKQKLTEMGEELLDQIKKDTEFKGILDQVKIEFVDEGMLIEIIESQHEAFFEIGTAKLSSKAHDLIKTIGIKLAALDNKLIIEGHTDARPYQNDGTGYTNYELSSDRANSARRVLVIGGVRENQIAEIRGYADKKLRNPSNPLDIFNRRVSIIVKYTGQK